MSSRLKNTEETVRRPKGNKRQRRQQIIAAVIAIILAVLLMCAYADTPKDLSGFDVIKEYLRNRTYALEAQVLQSGDRPFGSAQGPEKAQEPIADPVDPQIVRSQMERAKSEFSAYTSSRPAGFETLAKEAFP